MEDMRVTRRNWIAAAASMAALVERSRASMQGARGESVRAVDASGAPAPNQWLSNLLLVRPDSRPFDVVSEPKGDGTATIELPREKFDLTMVMRVRDFGEVYLHADNAGAHYSAAQVRGRELLLNYEFARSRSALVRRYVKAAQTEGVNFSTETMRRIERGEAALAKATAARETSARAGHANDSLAETMWAGEMAAVERARHRINRQGPRPGFLFGAFASGYARSEEYARRFNALLNYATVPFYRTAIERVEGSPDYRNAESIVEKMAGTGMAPKGHPLLWVCRYGIPEFMAKRPWEEIKRSCRDYVLRSVGRFRSRIHAWDVINEAHDWANELRLEHDQLLELTRLAAESARLADPTAFRVINCCLPWGEYVAYGQTPFGDEFKRPARTPLEYYRAVEDARIPYDAVGIQVYCPGRDMLEIERQLERFFIFGKPVHITELGIPTSSEGITGGGPLPYEHVWHGDTWNERIQADWIEQFYTICYSKPEIQAITWWVFSDSRSSRADPLDRTGLLRSDAQPKESYQRLMDLLASWRRA